MIFESKVFYVDLAEDKDLNDIVQVYNSNKYFLINHINKDRVTYEWIIKELESMKNADFYSCKI